MRINSTATNKGNYYDRTPLNVSARYNGQGIAPHAATSRTAYTVPANRKAFIDHLGSRSEKATASTTVGDNNCWHRYTALAQAAATMLQAQFFNIAVGTFCDSDLSNVGVMLAGDLLEIMTSDTSIGGTVNYAMHEKIFEFDA